MSNQKAITKIVHRGCSKRTVAIGTKVTILAHRIKDQVVLVRIGQYGHPFQIPADALY